METKNLDIYGHEPLLWTLALEALGASRGPAVTFFLGTHCAVQRAGRGRAGLVGLRRRLGGTILA